MIIDEKDYYIELMDLTDLNNILEVYNSNKTFLLNHMGTDHVKYEWLLSEIESMKEFNFNTYKIVDKSSGRLIGILDMKIEDETYLSLFMLHSDYKNKGLGKLIYQDVEKYVKSLNSKCIRIDVVTKYDNAVIDFWTKRGFVKYNPIELNWTGKILPAVIMKKSLLPDNVTCVEKFKVL